MSTGYLNANLSLSRILLLSGIVSLLYSAFEMYVLGLREQKAEIYKWKLPSPCHFMSRRWQWDSLLGIWGTDFECLHPLWSLRGELLPEGTLAVSVIYINLVPQRTQQTRVLAFYFKQKTQKWRQKLFLFNVVSKLETEIFRFFRPCFF